jgi:hypothetical protein
MPKWSNSGRGICHAHKSGRGDMMRAVKARGTHLDSDAESNSSLVHIRPEKKRRLRGGDEEGEEATAVAPAAAGGCSPGTQQRKPAKTQTTTRRWCIATQPTFDSLPEKPFLRPHKPTGSIYAMITQPLQNSL